MRVAPPGRRWARSPLAYVILGNSRKGAWRVQFCFDLTCWLRACIDGKLSSAFLMENQHKKTRAMKLRCSTARRCCIYKSDVARQRWRIVEMKYRFWCALIRMRSLKLALKQGSDCEAYKNFTKTTLCNCMIEPDWTYSLERANSLSRVHSKVVVVAIICIFLLYTPARKSEQNARIMKFRPRNDLFPAANPICMHLFPHPASLIRDNQFLPPGLAPVIKFQAVASAPLSNENLRRESQRKHHLRCVSVVN